MLRGPSNVELVTTLGSNASKVVLPFQKVRVTSRFQVRVRRAIRVRVMGATLGDGTIGVKASSFPDDGEVFVLIGHLPRN